MKAVALLALLWPAWPARAYAPSPLFDGAGRERLPRPAATVPVAPGRGESDGTLDLTAAARFSNDAMKASLPRREPGERFAFGVIGDAEPGRFPWERVFAPSLDAFERQWNGLQARGADFVLQLGDFVSEGTAANYAAHVALLERALRRPLLRCIGNHDRSHPNGAADKLLYGAVFGASDYYFDHAGWRFVSLDSSDRKVTQAQLAWLRDVLAAPGPKVVFTHVPPAYLRSTKPLAEAAAPGWLYGGASAQDYIRDLVTNYFDQGAEEFERLIVAGGVRAVYMGHIHAFWAADRAGVRYVISGGGGSPLYPLPRGYPQRRFAHTLWVEAGPDGLSETVVPLQGASFRLPAVAR